MSKRSIEIRQAIGTASDELLKLTADATAFAAKEAEIVQLEGELTRTLAAEQRTAALGKPVTGDPLAAPAVIEASHLRSASDIIVPRMGPHERQLKFGECMRAARANLNFTPQPDKHFRNFGEQLQAIANAALSARAGHANVDARLTRAPTGASEVDPTGGGFLVQTDFAQAIFMYAHAMGEILSRVSTLEISNQSNGIKIKAVDETSRATGSRWGGVQSYWVGEGQTGAPSKPKFREVEFGLKKLIGIMYMTDELLQDTTALSTIAGTAFAEEVMFMTEDAIFEGTGVGQPLGILKSPGRVTVAKASGQATGTILTANIEQMWSQLWIRSQKNAVWFFNQEIWPQLFQLNQPVGTAGGQIIFTPPGGLSSSPYATLMGRPLIPIEYAAALSTEGDLVLADLTQYQLVEKGGINTQMSMHIAFLTDESVFRITYRVDGKPMWYAPMTPFKGTTPKSPFITLQTR